MTPLILKKVVKYTKMYYEADYIFTKVNKLLVSLTYRY